MYPCGWWSIVHVFNGIGQRIIQPTQLPLSIFVKFIGPFFFFFFFFFLKKKYNFIATIEHLQISTFGAMKKIQGGKNHLRI
jgi:hypothetical protein